MLTPLVTGMGYFLPDNIVANKELVGRINTSESFILERTGVVTRHHASPEHAVSDLMVPAAIQAINNAGLTSSDIDFLLVNTLSPDHHDPSQACLLQPKLALGNIPAMDIRAQCSGFLYGLEASFGLLATKRYRNILLICGEVLSKRMDCSDRGRNLAVLLGDGAGAAVISAAKELGQGLLDIELGADGHYFDLLMTAKPGSRGDQFVSQDSLINGETDFLMNGRPMFEHASNTLVRIAQEMLAKHKLNLSDIDHVVCHQPNLRILDEVQRRLSIPKEKLKVTVDRLGNMASASFPVTLAMLWPDLKPNQTILMLTYGSGATWGAALYRMPATEHIS